MSILNRRTMLIGSGLGAAIATAYGLPLTAGSLRSCADATDAHGRSLAKIGRVYLASAATPDDIEQILSIQGMPAEKRDAFLTKLATGLPERSARDFAEDRTVNCDGWVISKSEAMFCAHLAVHTGQVQT